MLLNVYHGDQRAKRIYLGTKMIFPQLDENMQSVIDYASDNGFALPSALVIKTINELITNLKIDGILSKLDLLYLFFGDGSVGFKTINLVNPLAYNATAFGGLTWSDSGVTGNGIDGYINTDFNPSLLAEGQKYQLNDASRGAVLFSNNSTNNSNGAIDGVIGRSDNIMIATNTTAQRINQGENNLNDNVNFSGDGLKYIGRTTSTDVNTVNKDFLSERTRASTVIYNGDQCIFRRASNIYGLVGISSYFNGASLTFDQTQELRTIFNSAFEKLGLDQVA